MKIAFTHNLRLSDSEDEAEFDSPETVARLTAELRALGHEVEPVEVSGPSSRVVARLEALAPDLVFNTAEGTRGRFREAFFPALFEKLGLPFTGSDAYVCAVTLDKQLSKMLVAKAGVPTPKWRLIAAGEPINVEGLRFPLIMKPNYEGSSMGITVDSVVEDRDTLMTRLPPLLSRFPAGILVEEFIVGRDITVPFLERASPGTGGVLEPASYRFDAERVGPRRYEIYDYTLKDALSDAVAVNVPADITPAQREEAMRLAKLSFQALGIRDLGRVDLRLAEDGSLTFLEVNALPSLEPGASIYEAAKLAGCKDTGAVLEAVIASASERFGLDPRVKPKKKRAGLRVGLTFNLRRKSSTVDGPDEEAEFDSRETINAIRDAIASYGHEVVELEATPELPSVLPAAGVDLVFNIAEGFAGRFRESQVPALLELLGIPYTGSDPTALSLALDKGLAKRLVASAGLRTPKHVLMLNERSPLPKDLKYPVIAKPVAEGTSKGITEKSVARNADELREVVRSLAPRYAQGVLVEEFLPGREFTVGLLGEKKPRVLPPMEIIFTDPSEENPVYSFSRKVDSRAVTFNTAPDLTPALRRDIETLARKAFLVLGCRDVSRIDIRLDSEGRASFIECNPLPGLSPGFSDLCVIAGAAGIDYRALIGEILAPAQRRLREKQRQRVLDAPL